MTLARSLCIALLATLWACEDDTTVTPGKTKTNKTQTTQDTATTEQAEAPPPITYSPIGKRDPFQSYLAELRNTDMTRVDRAREATEEYELDQYKLSGVVTGTSQPRALVEDPGGKGHVVRIGTRLGKNSGVVTRITSSGIVVTEEFRAPTGEKVRVPMTIKLPQPELEMGTEQ